MRERNQNCAEQMIKKAAKLVLNNKIQFRYEKNCPDVQVDISPAFLYSPDEEKELWYSGKTQALLEKDLQKLDEKKVYFLRTGTNNGAGHWQLLYYHKGWINYSTKTNNFQFTKNGFLTEEGQSLIVPYANWGQKAGEYSFLLVHASPQNIINAANYLYDFRMFGETKANECSDSPQRNFYKQLRLDLLEESKSKESSYQMEQKHSFFKQPVSNALLATGLFIGVILMATAAILLGLQTALFVSLTLALVGLVSVMILTPLLIYNICTDEPTASVFQPCC